MQKPPIPHLVDVTADTCPMTFVRTRLRLDRLAAGEVLEIRFRGQEPRENLPRSLAEQGHEVLRLDLRDDGDGTLVVRKGGA